ncbi:MAG: cupin domain-containing protein [Deltaproteobacteria bacterium]|nr:cupin domain-containing protein [Deltaproteobacteria bacterium]
MTPLRCLERLALSPAPSTTCGELDVSCSTLHQTRRSSLDVREYAPGEFEWRSDTDHCTCVVSGEAEIYLADGRELHLRPGVSIYLPRGLKGRWNVQTRLRTVSVCSRT